MLVGGVIIVAPQHRIFLDNLLVELSEASCLLDETIVVLSGSEGAPKDSALQQRLLSKTTKVLCTPLQSAGANRNSGMKLSQADLVFFMDADDLYSPDRIQIALSLLDKHEFDLMLHGFTPFVHGDSPPPFPKPPEYIEGMKVVTESSLYEATLLRSPRNRFLELKGETETTNLLFNDPAEAFEVHHAHAIVRREAVGNIRYHEEFGVRNEDGVFARDMLEAGKRVLLTPFVLSAYRHGARAKPRKPSKFFGQ